ncbi:MAG: ATP-binding protein [bacterium]
MFFKTLKSKIWFGYAVLLLIIIGVASWSTFNFIGLRSSINDILIENYHSIKAAEKMNEALERQDSAILLLLQGEEKQGVEFFQENEQDFYRWLIKAEENITIDGETKIVEKLRAKYSEYLSNFDKFRNLGGKKARNFYLEKFFSTFKSVKTSIRDLSQLNQEEMIKAQDRANQRGWEAIISTSGISAALVIVALVFVIYLQRLLLKPIKKLTRGVQKIQGGNLHHRIQLESEDEVGELAREFNAMTQRIEKYERMNIRKLESEKNKSEAIVNNISNPIIVTDNDHQISLLNPAAEEIFNCREKEAKEKHFLEVMNNQEIFDHIEKALEEGASFEQKKEVVDLEVNGQKKSFRLMVKPVSGKDQIELVVTLLDDITRLKEVDRMKSEFVHTVSHEFRSPLTSIRMALDLLLEDENLDEEQFELLEAAEEDSQRLMVLVEDLLDLSKLESGQLELDFQATSPVEVTESAIETMETQLEEKQIELNIKSSGNIPRVWADSHKITWVLTNLVGNALRYTESGGVIDVKIRSGQNQVYISVSDSGPGIPHEYQDKIFEKFVRVGDDDTKGSGLGLAICQEIVEAHEGNIWVESEVGEGATFTFTLPTLSKTKDRRQVHE